MHYNIYVRLISNVKILYNITSIKKQLCEKVESYEKMIQKFKKGVHYLHAHADKGMLRIDEIVFYRTDQLTIKYLIETGN